MEEKLKRFVITIFNKYESHYIQTAIAVPGEDFQTSCKAFNGIKCRQRDQGELGSKATMALCH